MKATWNKLKNYIFPVILCLYPLRHVMIGLDLWDTGYNYANFKYMGTEHMDSMWLFSTYLANALGHFFTMLPGGGTLLGLNIYTGLLVSALALFAYYFTTRKLRFPKEVAFLAEFVAISLCWCPTALLYNYLTYVLLFAGVVALYYGLEEEKGKFLVLAGVCLGLNVFVRFSNLPQMALIVGVWAYAIVCKKKFTSVLKETGLCIAGYVLAFGGMLCYLSARYGFAEYVEGIKRLFTMTDTATDYKASSMITGMIQGYTENLYWVIRIGVFGVLAYLIYILPIKLPAILEKVRKVICILLAGLCLCWLYSREFAPMQFTEYISMLRPAVLFLMLSMAICLIQVFRPRAEKKERLIAGLIFLVILITPIGSNNRLYPAINNLFLVAPYSFCMIYRFLKWHFEKRIEIKIKRGNIQKTFGTLKLGFFPVKVFLLMFLLVFLIQSTGFGVKFVFAEAKGVKKADTKVENSVILKGILMEETRAREVEELITYVNQEKLSGREVILYGKIPAMSFYLDMPAAFNPWCDLASYQPYVMEERMKELDAELADMRMELRVPDAENSAGDLNVAWGKQPPVILLEKEYALYATGGEDALYTLGMTPEMVAEFSCDKKFLMIVDFMERHSYKLTFENEKFGLFEIGE